MGERDFKAAARLAIEEGASRNRDREHLLKAKRLRAQLHLIAVVRLALAALVLDRVRLWPELNNVGAARELQAVRAKPHATHRAR